MALQVTELKRVFKMTKDGKEIELSDPNRELSPEEVLKFYSSTHAELTNATIEGPKVKDGKAEYTAVTKAGKLG